MKADELLIMAQSIQPEEKNIGSGIYALQEMSVNWSADTSNDSQTDNGSVDTTNDSLSDNSVVPLTSYLLMELASIMTILHFTRKRP